MGTRFITVTVTLPLYKIRAALKIESIRDVLPLETYDFIKEDARNFVTAFGIKDEDNKLDKLEFLAFNARKQYFVFVPPHQATASKATKKAFASWGLYFNETPPQHLRGCTDPAHGSHQYLYPFFATNDQLLFKYDADDDEARSDLATLKSVRDNNLPHANTKFHCSGPPFKLGTPQYKELDWATRLYHCIKGKLPENITVEDTCRYRGGDFKDLQEIYSTIPESHYYYFTAIPDLVFTKKVVCTPPSTNSTTVALSVTTTQSTEYTDIIEVKNGGLLSGSRADSTPHAVAQIFSSLHVLAIAAFLKALAQNVVLKDVLCKGLLLNRNEFMVLCTLRTTIGPLECSECTLSHTNIEVEEVVMSIKDVCAAIMKLLQ